MLCGRPFKNRSDVALKITHFSPPHALPFTQTPSPKSPSRGPFSPSQPPFLSRRLPSQKPSHGHSRLSPHTPSLSRRHPFQNALRGLTAPAHAPPCLNTSRSSTRLRGPSQGLPRGFSEQPPEPLPSIVPQRFQRDASGEKRRFLRRGFGDTGQTARGVPGGVLRRESGLPGARPCPSQRDVAALCQRLGQSPLKRGPRASGRGRNAYCCNGSARFAMRGTSDWAVPGIQSRCQGRA